MRVRNVFGVLVIALSLAGAACSSNSSPAPSSTTTPATTPTTTPTTPSTPTTGATTTVSIVQGAAGLTNTACAPNPVNIKVGDSINWVNNDSIVHTSTANAGQWSSGTMAPGSSFKTTFSTAGSFTYHCAIHPGMVGTVTVQ